MGNTAIRCLRISFRIIIFTLSICVVPLLGACGGGDSVGVVTTTNVPSAPSLIELGFDGNRITLSWPPVDGATGYKVIETDEGISTELAQVTSPGVSFHTALYKKADAKYSVLACKGTECSIPYTAAEVRKNLNLLNEKGIGRFAPPVAHEGGSFGYSVAVSRDGNTMAIGEPGFPIFIEGAQVESTIPGRVHVYARNIEKNAWQLQDSVEASNPVAGAQFGITVALSADGNIMAVGSKGHDGMKESGAAYVFSRAEGQTDWTERAYIKDAASTDGDRFAVSVSLSDDGSTLAIGASQRDQVDSVGSEIKAAGAVFVYAQQSNLPHVWLQQGTMLQPLNAKADVHFGATVALSADGSTLAVGATLENSGVDSGSDRPSSGAAYVFTRSTTDNTWGQTAFIKAPDAADSDYFGDSLAISGDGNTLAVGAYNKTISGNEGGGRTYVYTYVAGANNWRLQASLSPKNNQRDDFFGASIALSLDGNTLASGAFGERSTAVGLNGNDDNLGEKDMGAVYVFTRNSAKKWTQKAYLKPPVVSMMGAQLAYWRNVALSGDAKTLAAGAHQHTSEQGPLFAGAVFLY